MLTKIKIPLNSFQSNCHPKRNPQKLIILIGSGDKSKALEEKDMSFDHIIEKTIIVKQGFLYFIVMVFCRWGSQMLKPE